MITQKIQTSTNVKGFTLVELIVVITILVILGTIAFLNLGGMSASARDSQRTSDLNQINQQIMVQQAKSGISYLNMISGTGNNLTSISLAGGAAVTNKYAAGNVGYTVLGIDKTKFQDPTKDTEYRMGATSLVGSAYELAASLEESKTALVMGSYRARTTANTASGTVSGSIITLTNGLGTFKIGDILIDGASHTGTVAGISGDLSRITFTGDLASSSGFVLGALESAGLIGAASALSTAVENGKTILPYSLD
ncbi:MAG: type II secretion system protein [Candidatus Gracilibacteria bacterium]|nr:type II secretion system protein [Candidatus Gracilibacteria bacterium]